jgi:hypothetical protein
MQSSFLLILLAAVGSFSVSCSALVPGATAKRRDVLSSLLLGGSLTGLAPPAHAATASDPSVFLGTYTDPVNHPGGTRTIELTGTSFAGYQLATVKGGGGRGEPSSFELPAMVFSCPGNQQKGGEWCITIDFTPKGGPKDFQGYWDEKEKGIRFVLDNNFWPMQPKAKGDVTLAEKVKELARD